MRTDFNKLRDAQPRKLGEAVGVEIFGHVQDSPAQVDECQSDVSRARVELGKLRSELEGSCNSNLTLKRGGKTAQERWETMHFLLLFVFSFCFCYLWVQTTY